MSALPEVLLVRAERTDSSLHRWRAVIVDEQGRAVLLNGRPWMTGPCFTQAGAVRRARGKIARLRSARTWTA